jgi:C4-type Zn-finger protein
MRNIADRLDNNPFLGTGGTDGDSTTSDTRGRMKEFNRKLNELIEGGKNFTFIMDDPTGNSYLQVGKETGESCYFA